MAIEERIGAYIGYKRKRLFRMTQNSQYTQKEFIKTTDNVSLYGCTEGLAVCSRSTLIKIENGYKSQETQLLDFFLRKLSCPHRIMDDELSKTNNLLNQYLEDNYLEDIEQWLSNLNNEVQNLNLHLFVFDYYALKMINRYFKSDTTFSIQSILHLLEILRVINQKLFTQAVELICFEIYFKKEFWSYASTVIERFRVMNVDTEISRWFNQVFQSTFHHQVISFPNITKNHKYFEQIKKYNWYIQQPLFTDQDFSYQRNKLSGYSRFLKYEPYPFSLSIALMAIHTI